MFRVLACITDQHDYRLLALAVAICAVGVFTAFHTHAHATERHDRRRVVWVLLTGISAAVGIWSTHFVAMLAYVAGHPTDYDAVQTIISLLVASIMATAGFSLASAGTRQAAVAGGAIVGAGIGGMHFAGMQALIVPGTLRWDVALVIASLMIGAMLASAALYAWHGLASRKAFWVAPPLLVAAICGMHFTAMGAVTIEPEPTIVVSASAISATTLAIVVAGVSMLVMLATVPVTLLTSQAEREASRHNQELVDAALEGLVVAKDGVIVNVNRRILKLTQRSQSELLGKGVLGDLLGDAAANVHPSGRATEAFLKNATGIAIPVEVVCRPLQGGARANEVYAIRDLTERRQAEQELRRQNDALRLRDEELRTQNRRFEATLANMPHGLCMIDADRRLAVCNKRYAEMYDLPPRLVVPGTPIAEIFEYLCARGLYSAEDAEEYRREGLTSLFAPTAKIRRLNDGRSILISRRSTDGGWIAIHDDITERQRLYTRLEEQKAELGMALANMSQGLAMFDAEERLVLANDRYAEVYGLDPRHLRPGTTLLEIIERRFAKGLYPGRTVDEIMGIMRDRIGRKTASHMISRPGDGRVLSVSITPRVDGGWVVTIEDITEREELNARLKKQNALLQQREAELAAQNSRFDAAIGNMSQGMCLFDAQHRITFANNRYSEIYGLTREQLTPGTTIRQIFEARAVARAFGDAEIEDYVRQGIDRFSRYTSEVIKLTDGRFVSVVRRPMPDGGLLSTHEDITEREQLNAQLTQQYELLTQREKELNARNEQLDALLENMLQGVAMYDAEQRLIICNKHYAAMYGLTPEQIAPGTTVRQMFEHRLASGHYHVKDSEGFVSSWAGDFGEVSSRIQELADGRIISVLRRRTANGGRVITHEDITERQQLSSQLERQNGLLKEQDDRLRVQNLQLDAALNNMVQGLAMYDAEQRLVLCNQRYAEMYGLEAEQAKPGTPLREIIKHRIAKGEFAGNTADQLLDQMLERIAGHQPAHYVSHMSDGRHIAVSVQPMPGGGALTTHHDITEQRRSEARIAHMALHDLLTGLPNRTLLNERLDHALKRIKRGEMVATHLLDLDHFKDVNDSLGHPIGDKLLKLVGERLRALARDTDTVARMGGDEFAIVQPAIEQPADATSLAHRVIEALSAPYDIGGHQVVIGTSVGIAVGPSDGVAPDQLMRNADLALYRAKSDGRGTYRFFEHEMDAQMQVRRTMEDDLRRALPAGEFELYFQPIVHLASDDVSGFEALVRWQRPERGIISPGAFIPLAEETGFIIPLGEWVIREACATAAKWPGGLKVAVNLSAVQFRSPGLVQVVLGALASSGLPAERLELEITETVLLQDSEATLSTLYQLRALGVRIAMDDFGTGYSSLSYLQSFPFDKIKIDRSFVKDITEGVESLNIVRAIAAMASGLGMTTTAEGVETREQLAAVRSEGCTETQGFVYSKPMPGSEVEAFLMTWREQQAGNGAGQSVANAAA